MDPFHRNKAVKEKIRHPKACRDILELLQTEKIEEVFRYLELYRNSLCEEGEIQDVEDLIRYYENNREGLVPYQSQGAGTAGKPGRIRIPKYGDNGEPCMECPCETDETLGIEGWSRRGGNHLAKILAKKCSGKLYEVTERLRRPVFEEEKVEELYGEILMSANVSKGTKERWKRL